MSEWIQQGLDIFFHLDAHLNHLASVLGPALYVLLFMIVFCETGLVVTPVLPGDSLLFAVGALAAVDGAALNVHGAAFLLAFGAVIGDAVNYGVGAYVGPAVFKSDSSRWLNKRHLQRTHDFYERHGGKTIILARFIPILRTFAPFVAGMGKMGYPRFAAFNVAGGVLWVCSFVYAGYLFGNVPVVKRNFHFVVVAIVLVSTAPPVIEFLRARRARVMTGPPLSQRQKQEERV